MGHHRSEYQSNYSVDEDEDSLGGELEDTIDITNLQSDLFEAGDD